MKDCKHGKLVFSDTTACISSHHNYNYDLTKFLPEGRRKRTASVVDDATEHVSCFSLKFRQIERGPMTARVSSIVIVLR